MKITLTEKMLLEKGACSEAIKAIKAYFKSPDDYWATDWTLEKQIEIIKSPIRKYIGWGFSVGLFPLWSLSGANLSRADLSGADLSGTNLSRADLYGANLSRADLSMANLSGADLSMANLSRADLYGANLSGADLYGANLSGALGLPENLRK